MNEFHIHRGHRVGLDVLPVDLLPVHVPGKVLRRPMDAVGLELPVGCAPIEVDVMLHRSEHANAAVVGDLRGGRDLVVTPAFEENPRGRRFFEALVAHLETGGATAGLDHADRRLEIPLSLGPDLFVLNTQFHYL